MNADQTTGADKASTRGSALLARLGAWFRKAPQEQVLLRMHDGDYLLKPVEWHCGTPFAAPYLPHTRCQLLPQGKLIGQSYVHSWMPASPAMHEFFNRSARSA
jgi:hypothetical protein